MEWNHATFQESDSLGWMDMQGSAQLDIKAIVGEPVDMTAHVHCVHCDVMLPEFSRYCLLCGAAQFVAVIPERDPHSQAPADAPAPEESAPVPQALAEQELQAPEVLYVEPQVPPHVPPASPEPSPMERLRAMQKMADSKLSRMEADRAWAKNIFRT